MDRKNIMKNLKYALRFLPDEIYMKLYFRLRLKRQLDLDNPKSFNEKLQWLKLNDRNPKYTNIVDKYRVREYIKNTIGEEYLIPLLGVWDNFEEIKFDELPEKFVLKCNHDSGGLSICTDKSKFDIEKARKKIEKSLKCQFYYIGREWQYKNIKRKIICEEFIGDENNIPPIDYKISCFNGKPDNIMVCCERETGNPKFYFFDTNWNQLNYSKANSKSDKEFIIKKPSNLDEMLNIAEKLSSPYFYSRIDLYNKDNKIYFGEITLSPNSGFDNDYSYETDLLLGKKLKLPI